MLILVTFSSNDTTSLLELGSLFLFGLDSDTLLHLPGLRLRLLVTNQVAATLNSELSVSLTDFTSLPVQYS